MNDDYSDALARMLSAGAMVLPVLCIPDRMPRNALSMKNKLELIECFEREKLSVKQLQERFNCGKTQVYEAIRKKEEIKKDLEKGRIKDYKPCDVYNGDETGIFFRALPSNYALCRKDENCGGGKDSKERLTLFVCGNMSGELITPMTIGKSARPRCFKNLDIRKLPVTWKNNENAWNTASIMEEWLKNFNSDMKKKGRKVILFLDSAACHPKIRLSNVELAWLPTNASSVTQPMNQGVIRSLKALYRKHLLRSLLCAVDSETAVSDLSKKITVLDAINWINLAVKEIKPTTVISGFAKAGFLLLEDSEIESTHDLDRLQDLMGSNASAEEFVNFDNDLPICSESETVRENTESGTDCESDEEVNSSSNDDRSIKSYKEMLMNLKDLVDSSVHKGNSDLFNILNEAIVNVENCIIKENGMTQSE
ncbi:hypothetical protein J437_LFUL004899 [Ladona fulva]|uniref:Uncharacterized protein n=1 Tax=Ladona fulva TaxID=123851 RepID=A0A8K0JZ44_LADFU|nr:hypothetical protein J437_LFUL004899 [Ladona fulva]